MIGRGYRKDYVLNAIMDSERLPLHIKSMLQAIAQQLSNVCRLKTRQQVMPSGDKEMRHSCSSSTLILTSTSVLGLSFSCSTLGMTMMACLPCFAIRFVIVKFAMVCIAYTW